MKNILLPSLLFLLLVSCSKKQTVYRQAYTVTYFPTTDSFTAAASFIDASSGGYASLLAKKESVTFNGRTQDYIDHNIYWWTGKGKPDGNFVLTEGKHKLANFISASRLGNYQLIFPDTISKSVGFTIKIIGYDPSKNVDLHLINPGKNSSGLAIKGDSCYLHPLNLTDYPEGKMLISLYETIEEPLQSFDENTAEKILYRQELNMPVQFIK